MNDDRYFDCPYCVNGSLEPSEFDPGDRFGLTCGHCKGDGFVDLLDLILEARP